MSRDKILLSFLGALVSAVPFAQAEPVSVGAVNCGQFHYPKREAVAGEYTGGWTELAKDNPADVFFYEDVGRKPFPKGAKAVPGLDICAACGTGEVSVVELPRTISVEGAEQSTKRYRALRVVREWNGKRLCFLGVHLVAEGHIRGPKPAGGGYSFSQQLRQRQFAALIEESRKYDYAVLCGDFNAQRADEYEIFTKAGFTIANCSERYGTRATLRNIPADNIVLSPGLDFTDFRVLDFYSLDTDHYPVVAKFDLKNRLSVIGSPGLETVDVARFLGLPRKERVRLFMDAGFRRKMFEAGYPDGEGLLSRWVRIDGIPNLRDIGGLPTVDGKMLRRGILYRSAGWNDNSRCPKDRPEAEWQAGKSRLTAKGAEQVKALGIRTDLDLRKPIECWGMKGSPIGAEVNWRNVPFGHYARILAGKQERRAVAEAFSIIADESNLPLVFHCIGGADRTGCLAMLIELVCGVDEETALKDWELTGCYTQRLNFVHEKTIDRLLADLHAQDGATIEARTRSYLAACGVSAETIDRVRDLLRR